MNGSSKPTSSPSDRQQLSYQAKAFSHHCPFENLFSRCYRMDMGIGAQKAGAPPLSHGSSPLKIRLATLQRFAPFEASEPEQAAVGKSTAPHWEGRERGRHHFLYFCCHHSKAPSSPLRCQQYGESCLHSPATDLRRCLWATTIQQNGRSWLGSWQQACLCKD